MLPHGFAAELESRKTEIGTVTQGPGEPVPTDFKGAAAGSLCDAAGTGFQKNRPWRTLTWSKGI